MEAGAKFDQRSYLSAHSKRAIGGTKNAGHQLEQRAFARAVPANDSHRLARKDREVEISKDSEFFVIGASLEPMHEGLAQRVPPFEDHPVAVLNILKSDGRFKALDLKHRRQMNPDSGRRSPDRSQAQSHPITEMPQPDATMAQRRNR